MKTCPECSSNDVTKASVIYESGTKSINTTTAGIGIGGALGGVIGGGGGIASTSGTSQTLLAGRLTLKSNLLLI